MEIKVINFMTYLFSNNVIIVIRKQKKITCPTVEIFFNDSFMISIIVHLPSKCQTNLNQF